MQPAHIQRHWLLERFALGPWNYRFTFIADVASALFFLAWETQARQARPAFAALGALFGYLLWTLTEYVFHRWVYHREQSLFGKGHRIHHDEPLLPVAMPWFMTTFTVFGLWYACDSLLGIPLFSSLLAGWLIGFVWYSLVHHGHHHWDVPGAWMRKLKAYHRVHHQVPGCNYGVTMRFWDDVFGTRLRKPPRSESPEVSTVP